MSEEIFDLDAEAREQRIQREGEQRIGPYLEALHMRIAQITKTIPINTSDLTLVFPKSEWEDLEIEDGATVLGCRIVFANVPTMMVAVPVPKARVAYATLRDTDEAGS
ncbi:hypothetical protein [Nocardia sp. Marseille-Q1738]